MKSMDPKHTSEQIEAWLDGRLEGRDAIAFQARLEREPELAAELELAERIQASLRRSFVPPNDLSVRPRPAPVGSGTRSDRGGDPVGTGAGLPGWTWRRTAAVVTAAAAVLLFLRLSRPSGEGASPGLQTAREDLRAGEEALRPVAPGSAVGPLASAELGELPPQVSAPDLEALYAEALAGAGGGSMTCGPEDDLGATLAAAYGEPVTLRPEADQMLSGPFASTLWPTGTILRGAGANPSILVAERETTHRCCVLFELSPESDLNLFTWQLGDLVLTEITPLDEPRLLGYFE